MKLQLSLQQAAMPVNDHLIHATPVEQHNYIELKQVVEDNFYHLPSLKTLFPEQVEGISQHIRQSKPPK